MMWIDPTELQSRLRKSLQGVPIDAQKRDPREEEDLVGLKRAALQGENFPSPPQQQGPPGHSSPAFGPQLVQRGGRIAGIPTERELREFGSSQARDVNSLASRLQRLMDDTGLRTRMEFQQNMPGILLNDPYSSPAMTYRMQMQRSQMEADAVAKERDRAMSTFMAAMGMPLKAYDAETGRSSAAVQEYATKQGQLERQLGEMALEQLRQQGELQKAEINNRAMSRQTQLMLVKDALQALKDSGQDSAENVKAVLNRYKLLSEHYTPQVNTGYRGEDHVAAFKKRHGLQAPDKAGRPAAPVVENKGDAMDALAKAFSREGVGVSTTDFINRALPGRKVDERGTVVSKGEFDPEHIAKVILEYGEALKDSDIKLLVDQISKEGYGDKAKIMGQIAKTYQRLSRRANKAGGAADWQIEYPSTRGRLSQPVFLQRPGFGRFYAGTEDLLLPYFSGSKDLIPTIRKSTADEAERHARALQRFMDLYVRNLMGQNNQ